MRHNGGKKLSFFDAWYFFDGFVEVRTKERQRHAAGFNPKPGKF